MVSSVAAGSLSENDDSPMHGVAFNSNILFTAIQLAEPDENYDPVDLGDSSGNNAPDFTGIDNFFSQLFEIYNVCLLYTSPSPRDQRGSRMPSSA